MEKQLAYVIVRVIFRFPLQYEVKMYVIYFGMWTTFKYALKSILVLISR